jgi:hypothetical protein
MGFFVAVFLAITRRFMADPATTRVISAAGAVPAVSGVPTRTVETLLLRFCMEDNPMVQPISWPQERRRGTLLISRLAEPARLAQAKLAVSPYLALRALTCDSHEGVLSIRGQVCTYYLKQMAQVAVRNVPGVEEINNQVQVSPGGGHPTADRRGS